jgi:hypothetical protein
MMAGMDDVSVGRRSRATSIAPVCAGSGIGRGRASSSSASNSFVRGRSPRPPRASSAADPSRFIVMNFGSPSHALERG